MRRKRSEQEQVPKAAPDLTLTECPGFWRDEDGVERACGALISPGTRRCRSCGLLIAEGALSSFRYAKHARAGPPRSWALRFLKGN